MEQQRFSIAHRAFRQPDSCGRTRRSQQASASQTRCQRSAWLKRSCIRSAVILAGFSVYRGHTGLGTAVALLSTVTRMRPNVQHLV